MNEDLKYWPTPGFQRDPARIPEILDVIQKLWKRYPDLRLGQLLSASLQQPEAVVLDLPEDVYFVEDAVFLVAVNSLNKLAEEIEQEESKKQIRTTVWQNVQSALPDVYERVKLVLIQEMGDLPDGTVFNNWTSIQEDFKADELDELEILMALEDEFGIDIADEEWGISGCGDILDAVFPDHTVADAVFLVLSKLVK